MKTTGHPTQINFRLSTLLLFFFVFPLLSPAQYYWVGGSGDWSDYANHWATASGGNVFHNAPPESTDDVFFDANSFSTSGQTVSIDMDESECASMDWTGVTNNPSFDGTNVVINIYGSFILSPDMTCNLRFIELESDDAGNVISTGGTALGSSSIIRFRGSGSWDIQDVVDVRDFQMLSGTVNTNGNKIITSSMFQLSGNDPKTVNLGSSILDIGQWRMWGTNNTLNAGTSTIKTRSFYGDQDNTGPYNYHNVELLEGGILESSATFNKLTLGSNSYSTDLRVESGIVLTVNELEVLCTRQHPLDIFTKSEGLAATIHKTSGIVNASYFVMKDIHATGGATFNAIDCVDNGNNTGWNITPLTPRDYYWVGNGGVWSDLSHWAVTSGGAVTYTELPSRFDNMRFDENSFSLSGQEVEVDITTGMNDIDFTGATNMPTIDVPYGFGFAIFGSFNIPDNAIRNIYNIQFVGEDADNFIYAGSEGTFQNLAFWGSGTYTLMDDIDCGGFKVYDGTMHTNGQHVTARFDVEFSNHNNGMTTLGDSYISCRHYIARESSATFDAGTSHIEVRGNLTGNGFDYYEVTLSEEGSILDDNTFEILNIAPGTDAQIEAGSNQIINSTLNLGGTSAGPINLSSTIDGTQATFTKASGTVNGTYLVLQDMNATGGATFNALQAVDNGNNTGWNIIEITPREFYWVGGSGFWSDFANHWATTSGGNTFHPDLPGVLDKVYFDANSFNTTDQIVTIDLEEVNFDDMDWSAITNNPTLNGSDKTMNIYGSLIFSEEMTVDVRNYNFLSVDTESFDPGPVGSPGTNSYLTFSGGGVYNLLDTMTCREFVLENGTFNTNDIGMHVDFKLGFIDEANKVLNLGSSTLTARSVGWNSSANDNLTFNGSNSYIFSSSSFAPDPQTGNNINISLNNLHFIDLNSTDEARLQHNIVLNKLIIDAGKTLEISGGKIVTVNELVVVGTPGNEITIQSINEGTQAFISQSSGVVDGYYLNLKDCAATGGAEFNAYSSIDLGNVSGWIFHRMGQSIDFPNIADRLSNVPPFEIVATASSGLDIEFEVISGPATVDGATVSLTGPGEVSIRASQSGDIGFDPAPSVINSFCSTPLQPSISDEGVDPIVLTSSSEIGNQWFLDGDPIDGETEQNYTIPGPGSYTVQVGVDGCTSDLSEPYDFMVSTEDNLLNDSPVEIWPNPIQEDLFIKVNPTIRNIDYSLYNIQGMLITRSNFENNLSGINKINLPNLQTGTYMLQLATRNDTFSSLLVKME